MGILKREFMSVPRDYAVVVTISVAALSKSDAIELLKEILELLMSEHPEILGFEIIERGDADAS